MAPWQRLGVGGVVDPWGLAIFPMRVFPETFATPEREAIPDSGHAPLALLGVMPCRRILPGTAKPDAVAEGRQPPCFRLDHFTITIVVVGLLFVPVAWVFPHRSRQAGWREDVVFDLVGSMRVRVLSYRALVPGHVMSGTARTVATIPFRRQVVIIMFGTQHLPDRDWPQSHGVVGDDVPRGYGRQVLHPFRRP